jgi:hypothetical protein
VLWNGQKFLLPFLGVGSVSYSKASCASIKAVAAYSGNHKQRITLFRLWQFIDYAMKSRKTDERESVGRGSGKEARE